MLSSDPLLAALDNPSSCPPSEGSAWEVQNNFEVSRLDSGGQSQGADEELFAGMNPIEVLPGDQPIAADQGTDAPEAGRTPPDTQESGFGQAIEDRGILNAETGDSGDSDATSFGGGGAVRQESEINSPVPSVTGISGQDDLGVPSSEGEEGISTAALLVETLHAANGPPMYHVENQCDIIVINLDDVQDLALALRYNKEAGVFEIVDGAQGSVLSSFSSASFSQIVINGAKYNRDTLIVDLSGLEGRNLEVVFNGGDGGFDSLQVTGGEFESGQYIGIGADSGVIEFTAGDAKVVVRFTGLEPTSSSTALQNLTFRTLDYGAGVDVLVLDSPAPGTTRISGTIGGTVFENFTFANVTNLVLDTHSNDSAGADADSVTINEGALAAAGLQNLTVETGGGDDRVTIYGGVPSLPVSGGGVTISAGPGSDTVTINGTSGADTFDLSGSVLASGGNSISISDVDLVEIAGLGGADLFRVTPSVATAFNITGGSGQDELRIDGLGLMFMLGARRVTVAGRLPITYAADVENPHVVNTLLSNPRLDTLLENITGDLAINASGSLDILGQIIEGDFAIRRVAGTTTVSSNISRLELTVGGTRVLALSGQGDFLVTENGVAGAFLMNLAQNSAVPNLQFGGTFELRVNTTGSEQAVGTATVAAGPYLRVAILSASVTAPGGAISADGWVMEKQGVGAEEIIKVAATGVGLLLRAGTATLTAGNGSGAFVINRKGLAGKAGVGSVVLSGIPGVTLAASNLAVEINTTGEDVQETITLGGSQAVIEFTGEYYWNFLRLAGTGAIAIDRFMEFSGHFGFEVGTNAGGGQILKGAASNVIGFMGENLGTAGERGLRVQNINGAFLMAPEGFAMDASGSVSLVGMNGITLSGAASIRINNTVQPINETVATPAGDRQIVFATPALIQSVDGSLSAGINGFANLAGNFSIEKSIDGANAKIVAGATGVNAFVGEGGAGVRIAGGTLGLVLQPGNGLYALRLEGAASLEGLPNAQLAGNLAMLVNTTGNAINEVISTAGGDVALQFASGEMIKRLQGTVELNLAGYATLAGAYSIEKTGSGTTAKLLVSASNVTAFMGANGTGVRIQDAQLGMVIYPTVATFALTASGTASFDGVSGITLGGTMRALVNTTGNAVSESIVTVNGIIPVNFTDQQSNLMRFEGSGVDLVLGDAARLTGNLAVQRETAAGTGETRLAIGAAGVQAFLGFDGRGFRLGNGRLGMLILENGSYALQAAGEVAVVGFPDVEISGFGELGINNTGAPVNETVATGVPGANGTVAVNFNGNHDLQLVGGDIIIRIAGSEFTAGELRVVKSGNQLELSGQDIAFLLQAGARRIVQIANADFGFVFEANGVYGAVVNADLTGPDFGGNITLAGTAGVYFNTTSSAQSLIVGGQAVNLSAPAGGFYMQVELANAQLGVYGNSLTADRLVLTKAEADVEVSGENLDFLLTAGARRIIGVEDADFAFRFNQAGIVGTVQNGVVSGPDFGGNITLGGTASLVFNTTAQNASVDLAGQTIVIPGAAAGQYVRVQVANGQINVFGNQLQADLLVFEKSGAVVSVSGQNLDFALMAGGSRVIGLQDASLAFVFTQEGIAGVVKNGDVQGPDFGGDFALAGTVRLLLNTTNADRTLSIGGQEVFVPAAVGGGHFVRFEVDDGSLLVLGSTLSARKFVFEQSGADVAVSGEDLSFALMAGTNRLLGVNHGDFAFLFTADGMAGAVVNTTLSGPELGNDLAISGTATVLINTTGTAQSLLVSGQTLNVPSGGAGGAYLKVAIDAGKLIILGQELSGDFSFEQAFAGADPVVNIQAANVELGLGDGATKLVTLTGGNANLLIDAAGITASFAGTVEAHVPGVDFQGTFTAQIDTRNPASKHVRVSGAGVALEVGGQTLTGNFVMEQVTTASGQKVVGVGISNLDFRLGDGNSDYVTVNQGEGAFLISPVGLAGTIQVAAAFNLPGVTLSGGQIKLEVNTANQAVNARFIVADSPPIDAILPPGPFVRITVIGANLVIGDGGPTLAGDFLFEKSTRADSTSVIRFAVANLSVTYEGQGITNGDGAFVLVPADPLVAGSGGLAGTASGTASVAVGGVSAGGSLGLRINKSGLPVEEHLELNGKTFDIVFADGADVFSFFGADLTLVIGDFVSIEGKAITFSGGSFSGLGLNLFVGRGPALLPDGSVNPSAIGVLLSDAEVGLKDLGAGQYVLYASGVVQILGVAGVTLSGMATIEINQSGTLQTVVMPDSSTRDLAANAMRFAAETVNLSLLGQTVSGNFYFSKPGTGAGDQLVVVAATELGVQLGGGTPILTVSNGQGAFVIGSDGFAGQASATISLNAGTGVALGGTYSLIINTMASAVDETLDFGGAATELSLPAGPYVRVAGIGASLSLAGQQLTGDFSFEQRTSGGLDGNLATAGDNTKVVTVAFSNASLNLGGGLASVSGASGLFILQANGLAGQASAALSLNAGSGASVSGSFKLLINRTGAAVQQTVSVGGAAMTISAPAGNYLKVTGTNINLAVAGQTLKGNFEFQQRAVAGGDDILGTADDEQAVSVAASQVSLNLGGGVLAVSNGAGLFLLTAQGLAGTLNAGVAISAGTGLALSGAFSLTTNSTNAAVDEQVDLDGTAVSVVAPAGPYLRVELRGIDANTPATLSVAGQTLSGHFDFEQRSTVGARASSVLTVAFAGVSLNLGPAGNPILSATNGQGLFVLGSGGLAGEASADVALAVGTGVSLTGTLKIAINNTASDAFHAMDVNGQRVTVDLPAGPYVRVAGEGITLAVGGAVDLTGNFSFEQALTGGNETVVKVAATQVGAQLRAGSVSMNLTNGSGLFILKTSGLAGRATGAVSLQGVNGLTMSATMTMEFNKTGVAFSDVIGGQTLNFARADYFQMSGAAALNIANFVSVSGSFGFESGLDAVGASVIKAGATQAQATLGVPGSFGVKLSGGELGLVLFGNGTYALKAAGTVSLQGFSALSLDGEIDLRVNNTNLEIHESVGVGTSVVQVDFGPVETSIARFEGSNLRLATPLGEIRGNIWFQKNGVTNEILAVARAVEVFVGDDKGTASSGDDVGVRLSNGEMALLLLPDRTFAFEVNGTVEIVGVPELEFVGSFYARHNATGKEVNRSITVSGQTVDLVVAAGLSRFGGDNVTLRTPVADLSGNFAVELTTTAGLDGILGTADDVKEVLVGATGISLFVGDDKGTPEEGDDLGVRVSNADLIVLVASGGYAFEASGQAAVLGVPAIFCSRYFVV